MHYEHSCESQRKCIFPRQMCDMIWKGLSSVRKCEMGGGEFPKKGVSDSDKLHEMTKFLVFNSWEWNTAYCLSWFLKLSTVLAVTTLSPRRFHSAIVFGKYDCLYCSFVECGITYGLELFCSYFVT